jgi:hypothetical protein
MYLVFQLLLTLILQISYDKTSKAIPDRVLYALFENVLLLDLGLFDLFICCH